MTIHNVDDSFSFTVLSSIKTFFQVSLPLYRNFVDTLYYYLNRSFSDPYNYILSPYQ